MKERLQKLISAAGLCSRRRAEEWIVRGKVTVNGGLARLGDSADPETDRICVDGRPLPAAPGEKRTVLLYKPRGVVTTLDDERGRRTVASLLPPELGRLNPVGRLDQFSEGLLLMTNDGDLLQRLTHPADEIDKTYRLWVSGWREGALEALRRPIVLDGYRIKPPTVRLLWTRDGSGIRDPGSGIRDQGSGNGGRESPVNSHQSSGNAGAVIGRPPEAAAARTAQGTAQGTVLCVEEPGTNQESLQTVQGTVLCVEEPGTNQESLQKHTENRPLCAALCAAESRPLCAALCAATENRPLCAATENRPLCAAVAALEITIHEGRNRQIRRMAQAAGLTVTRLKRVAEGGLTLGDLKPGQWRVLTAEELRRLDK